MSGKLTYESIKEAHDSLGKMTHEPNIFVYPAHVIVLAIRAGYIRKEGDRMFMQNYPYPGVNGSEVFLSENINTSYKGYEVSKMIFDEFEGGNDASK